MSPITEHPRAVHTVDGGVVLDISGGRLFSLNATGSMIFELLEQGAPDQRIVEELANRFSISRGKAESDFVEFRKALEELAVLPRRESPTTE